MRLPWQKESGTEVSMKEREAIDLLKELGYWEPRKGTKGILNPRLHFRYDNALAFAVDIDAWNYAQEMEDLQPGVYGGSKIPVHVIYSETDIKLYEERSAAKKAVARNQCSPRILRSHWLVVRKQPVETAARR